MESESLGIVIVEAISRNHVNTEIRVVLPDQAEHVGILLETAKSFDDCVVYKLKKADGTKKTIAAPYPHDYCAAGSGYTVEGHDVWNPLNV